MKPYTFLCITPDGAVSTLDIHDCGSDGAALEQAASVFHDHESCVEVEVWQAERPIVRMLRPHVDAAYRGEGAQAVRLGFTKANDL
jgi:hypothetical protein